MIPFNPEFAVQPEVSTTVSFRESVILPASELDQLRSTLEKISDEISSLKHQKDDMMISSSGSIPTEPKISRSQLLRDLKSAATPLNANLRNSLTPCLGRNKKRRNSRTKKGLARGRKYHSMPAKYSSVFSILSDEMIVRIIVRYLSFMDATSLGRCNKHLRRVCGKERVWKGMLRQEQRRYKKSVKASPRALVYKNLKYPALRNSIQNSPPHSTWHQRSKEWKIRTAMNRFFARRYSNELLEEKMIGTVCEQDFDTKKKGIHAPQFGLCFANDATVGIALYAYSIEYSKPISLPFLLSNSTEMKYKDPSYHSTIITYGGGSSLLRFGTASHFSIL
eukprot:TRINITY_DN1284_c0_g1_i2.p1 TRINITY_DN1284_c0_g1~~TRINITY_DN1284_c0_g1_i2.p1  ORF type:complete len:336 (+),score=39.80 TRINITY_DN1284_c0_g1_i2:263-1270(+)